MKTPPIPPPWRGLKIIELQPLAEHASLFVVDDENTLSGDNRIIQAVAICAWEAEAERAEQKAYFQAVNNAKEWRKWR
jgi:hypothetical protein